MDVCVIYQKNNGTFWFIVEVFLYSLTIHSLHFSRFELYFFSHSLTHSSTKVKDFDNIASIKVITGKCKLQYDIVDQ